MNTFLKQFSTHFVQLNVSNLDEIGKLYADDVTFIDPLHQITGLTALRQYFEQMYANIKSIDFVMHGHDQIYKNVSTIGLAIPDDELSSGEGYLRWRMRFSHPRLKNGQTIEVEGCSHLRWSKNKVYYHRDYFDAGAMLYEHLPVMGRVIAWLKRRLV